MDKIEELKKLLWILDSKHNVSIPQTKENIDFIADEIVKLFCQPVVSGSLPPDEKFFELTEKICYQQFSTDPMGDIVVKMNLIKQFIVKECFGGNDR